MTHQEYENLVNELITGLVSGTPALLPGQVTGGRQNTIAGASGFEHQIDVSLRIHTALVLVECKFWSDPVDAEAILVLASRLTDIQDANRSIEVRASVVSTKAVTKGAQVLAKYFGISVDVVSSMNEYAVRLGSQVFGGLTESLSLTERVNAEITKGGVG